MGQGRKITITAEQEAWLKENFPNLLNTELCAHLGLSNTALHRFARLYGLKKSQANRAAVVAKQREGYEKFRRDTKRFNEFRRRVSRITSSMPHSFCNVRYNPWEKLSDERKAEANRKRSEKWQATRRRDILRIKMGLKPLSKFPARFLKESSPESLKRNKAKWNLVRKYGYEDGGGLTMFYGENTRRSKCEHLFVKRYGIKFVEKVSERSDVIVAPDWSDKTGGVQCRYIGF